MANLFGCDDTKSDKNVKFPTWRPQDSDAFSYRRAQLIECPSLK